MDVYDGCSSYELALKARRTTIFRERATSGVVAKRKGKIVRLAKKRGWFLPRGRFRWKENSQVFLPRLGKLFGKIFLRFPVAGLSNSTTELSLISGSWGYISPPYHLYKASIELSTQIRFKKSLVGRLRV